MFDQPVTKITCRYLSGGAWVEFCGYDEANSWPRYYIMATIDGSRSYYRKVVPGATTYLHRTNGPAVVYEGRPDWDRWYVDGSQVDPKAEL